MLESVVSSIDKLSLPYRVSGIRDLYFSGSIGFDKACGLISNKRDFSSYVVFSHFCDNGFKAYRMSKCSFRGNDVYKYRTYKKHIDLLNFCSVNEDKSYIVPDGNNGFNCSVWKYTLTVNPDLFWGRDDFNKSCSYWYDIFVKRLRNHFPDVVIARSYEVSTKQNRGFFHINVIAVFTDSSFPCIRHISRYKKDCKGNPVITWRCKNYSDKTVISDFWEGGFVDVQALQSPHELAEYSLKYYIKNFSNKNHSDIQDLTMSTLTLYNKRGFSFPRGSVKRGSDSFFNAVVNVTASCSSDEIPVFFPRLDIINHNSLKYSFEGFFYDYYNNYDSEVWYKNLDSPPPEIDPVANIDVSALYPDVVNLRGFDSGSRLIDGVYVSNAFFVPSKFTRQKKFRVGSYDKNGKFLRRSN